jgi:Domain of Unknown Function (DUF930)
MFLGTGEVIGNMYWSRQPSPWGLGASLGFHILIGLALLLVVAPRPQVAPPEGSVTVDVLTPQQFEAANKPPDAETRLEPPGRMPPQPSFEGKTPELARVPESHPRAAGNGMIKATGLLSAKVLADPRSAKARKMLGELASSERIVQLCNIEAMEQVHVWKAEFQPDFLVAYAMADTKLSGPKLQADGAAFRSKRRWYNIGFNCEVTPDLKDVASFVFLVGDEIPESEWHDHNLSVDDGHAD